MLRALRYGTGDFNPHAFRWPGTWSFVLLTKVTPGIGLLWFAARREWRNLAIALGVTAAIVAVSMAIDPALWRSWIELLLREVSSGLRCSNRDDLAEALEEIDLLKYCRDALERCRLGS